MRGTVAKSALLSAGLTLLTTSIRLDHPVPWVNLLLARLAREGDILGFQFRSRQPL